MLIYILVLILILFLKNNLSELPTGKLRYKTEYRYLKIICWVLVLLAALRGISVGADTIGYWQNYTLGMPKRSFAMVLARHADFPGYFLLAKTCSYLHFPVQLFFGIVEGIYIYAIYKFVNRYSKDKLYSILCFTFIGLYSFSLAGLKQTLSMAFVLLYFMALQDKKYIKTVLLFLAAYFCHHASLIFLGGVALYYLRNMRLFYVYMAAIVLVLLFGTEYVWTSMLELLENDHYSELYLQDKGYSSTTMIFYGVLVVILFLFGRGYMQKKKVESKVMLGMSTIAFALQALSFVSSAAFRLSLFFLPFMVVAFPNTFNRIADYETKKIVKFAVGFMIVFFFIYSNRNGGSVVPYKFFWQG